ncbi:hypothetical protein HanRHA438_Chr05g0234581 [Helianthus annuus]|nr:hypothetical protein HanRHA438_Chr05g0234581 [Helianthus annuus]
MQFPTTLLFIRRKKRLRCRRERQRRWRRHADLPQVARIRHCVKTPAVRTIGGSWWFMTELRVPAIISLLQSRHVNIMYQIWISNVNACFTTIVMLKIVVSDYHLQCSPNFSPFCILGFLFHQWKFKPRR